MPSAASARLDGIGQAVGDRREPTSLAEPPCPGRSSAMVRRRSASAGWVNIQVLRSPPKPWTNTTGDAVPLAELEIAQALAAGLDLARLGALASASACGRRFGGGEPGNEGVDLGVRHLIGRHHREQRADRQGRAGLGDDTPQGAGLAVASITLVIFGVSISSISSLGAKCLALALEPPRTLPSVMVRPHFGIVIAVMALAHARVSVDLADRGGDLLRARDVELFEARARTAPGCAARSPGGSAPSARRTPCRRRARRCRWRYCSAASPRRR